MKKLLAIITLTLCVILNSNAQESDRDLFLNDAKQLLNDGQYENALAQLNYFLSLGTDTSDADIEYVYVMSWIGLENYFEANRHIAKYIEYAKDNHENYPEIQSIKTDLEEEIKNVKSYLVNLAANATKNGLPYNWEQHSGLYPVGFAPKYAWCGYINKAGEIIIPFKYKVASHFENGIAYVENKISGDKELINPLGKVTKKLPQSIATVFPFQSGYAAVQLKELNYDKQIVYGIINEKGERIDANTITGYDQKYIFSDGSRYPIFRDGNFGAISVETGESVINEDVYAIVSTYHDGKILVRPKDYLVNQYMASLPSDFGMLDQKGNEIIPINSYPALEPFYNEYSIAGKAGKGYGVINKQLEIVIPFEHSLLGRAFDPDEFVIFDGGDLRGKARVYNARLDKMLSRSVQTTSKKAAFPDFTITYPSFKHKYMPLVTKKGKVRYYDHDLNDVFEKDFAFAKDFSEGMAAVMTKEGKTGYINEAGDLVIDYKYNIGQLFSQGLAAVAIGSAESEKYGFINNKGEEVIALEYDYAEPFFDATEIFKYYYSPKQLNLIPVGDMNVSTLDITFDTNEVFFHLLEGKKLALVKKKNKLQFIDQNGNVWLERLWSEQIIADK